MAWRTEREALFFLVVIKLGSVIQCRVLTGTGKAATSSSLKQPLPKGGYCRRGDSERVMSYGTLAVGNAQRNVSFKAGARGLRTSDTEHLPGFDNELDYQSDLPGFDSYPELDYQSDSAWNEHKHGKLNGLPEPIAQELAPAMQSLLHAGPLVECGTDGMMLAIQGGLPPHFCFLVDRGEKATPLPLMQLPPQCGYTLTTTWKNVIFTAPYKACYGLQEGGSYILPLLWLGIPVKMSCPIVPAKPAPPPSCYPFGMVVNIDGREAMSKDLQVRCSGWKAYPQHPYRRRGAGTVLSNCSCPWFTPPLQNTIYIIYPLTLTP
ncbi:hypothetical protein AAFF_G00227980 [Aldrovandia affinis]|uniref:Uncharacterized protein n=1 Tax=Aldrovandia affinis TaxID=143900 RepID=A0AAD7SV57_9TELE|nr:hypothetical protein AAFF_G00227980 [Aldrovandia affinis]